jgi:predicted nucleic acid-binding protein
VSVRLILDTTALLAYATADPRAVQVGELIASVEENGDTCGVPALCLIEAYRQIVPSQRRTLLELTGDVDGSTVVLPVLSTDVAYIGDLVAELAYDQAHAATAALKHDALLATYDRGNYGDAVDGEEILDL